MYAGAHGFRLHHAFRRAICVRTCGPWPAQSIFQVTFSPRLEAPGSRGSDPSSPAAVSSPPDNPECALSPWRDRSDLRPGFLAPSRCRCLPFRRFYSTAARSSIPGTSAQPCIPPKQESSSLGVSIHARILSSPRRSSPILRPSYEALLSPLGRHRIRRVPSESLSFAREAKTRAASGSLALELARESCCADRALRVLWLIR